MSPSTKEAFLGASRPRGRPYRLSITDYSSRRTWRRNHPKAAIPDPSKRRAEGSGTAVTLRLPDPSTRPDVKLLRLNPCKLVLTPLKLAMLNPSVKGPLKNPPTGEKLTSTLKSPLANPGKACDSPATNPSDCPTKISSAPPLTVTVPPGVPTGEATMAELRLGSTNSFKLKLVNVAV